MATSVIATAAALQPKNAWIPGPAAFSGTGFNRGRPRIERFDPVGAGSVGATTLISIGLSTALGAKSTDVSLNTLIGAASNYAGMRLAYGLAGAALTTKVLMRGTAIGAVQALTASTIQNALEHSPSVVKGGATGAGVAGATWAFTYFVVSSGAAAAAGPAILVIGGCTAASCMASDYLGGTWKSLDEWFREREAAERAAHQKAMQEALAQQRQRDAEERTRREDAARRVELQRAIETRSREEADRRAALERKAEREAEEFRQQQEQHRREAEAAAERAARDAAAAQERLEREKAEREAAEREKREAQQRARAAAVEDCNRGNAVAVFDTAGGYSCKCPADWTGSRGNNRTCVTVADRRRQAARACTAAHPGSIVSHIDFAANTESCTCPTNTVWGAANNDSCVPRVAICAAGLTASRAGNACITLDARRKEAASACTAAHPGSVVANIHFETNKEDCHCPPGTDWGGANSDSCVRPVVGTRPPPGSGGASPGGARIRVLAATYGAGCPAKPNEKGRSDVTRFFADACNGRTGNCAYPIDHHTIGDPSMGCPKGLVVRYVCEGGPDASTKVLTIEHEASGKVAHLSCGPPLPEQSAIPPTLVAPRSPPPPASPARTAPAHVPACCNDQGDCTCATGGRL